MKNINYVGHKKYIEAITDADLDWLKHDLSFVPKGSLVFLNMHAAVWNSTEGEGNVRNAEELADALKDYQVHVLTGHTHYFQNNVMDAQLWNTILVPPVVPGGRVRLIAVERLMVIW